MGIKLVPKTAKSGEHVAAQLERLARKARKEQGISAAAIIVHQDGAVSYWWGWGEAGANTTALLGAVDALHGSMRRDWLDNVGEVESPSDGD